MAKVTAKRVEHTFLGLSFLNTFATALIFGINTLFLLDAGLTNVQAFAANAFFTLGQAIFEVPTGVVADTVGRKVSYALGSVTLSISTILYFYAWHTHADFWFWAVTSIVLGLGYTFFSGATEAWLVDALTFVNKADHIEPTFARSQMVNGAAMLTGSVLGGLIAQHTNLGIPYVLRSAILLATFVLSLMLMHDYGFTPDKKSSVIGHMKSLLKTSVNLGIRTPSVRWVILAGPFTMGIVFYGFYAMQPYLLELYGDPNAYSIAGLAAAIVASAQIFGGFIVPYIRKIFTKRTTILATGIALNVIALACIGFIQNFWVVVIMVSIWGIVFAASMPVRQTYLNKLIQSKQRATVLSFDSLVSSSGGIIFQPPLGKVADVYGYAASYVVSAAIQLIALPFVILAKRQKVDADVID